LTRPKATLNQHGYPDLAANDEFIEALRAASPETVELLLQALDKHTKIIQPYWI